MKKQLILGGALLSTVTVKVMGKVISFIYSSAFLPNYNSSNKLYITSRGIGKLQCHTITICYGHQTLTVSKGAARLGGSNAHMLKILQMLS